MTLLLLTPLLASGLSTRTEKYIYAWAVENLHRHSSVTSRLTVNFQLQLSRLNEKVGMRREKIGEESREGGRRGERQRMREKKAKKKRG